MTTIQRKLRTARRHFAEGGLQALRHLSLDITKRWLRRRRRFAVVQGCRFSLAGLPDSMIELLLSDKYERAERTMLERDLDCDLPVVELGGCIGVLACLINRRLTSPERHVVVEANPRLASAICANRERNQCRFRVVSKALAYNGDVVQFSADDEFLANRVVDMGSGVPVKTTTYQALLEESGITRCTLICDIEGNEYQLVDREIDVLARSVRHLVVEVHPKVLGVDKVNTMLERLRTAGFVMVRQLADTYAFLNPALAPAPNSRGHFAEREEVR